MSRSGEHVAPERMMALLGELGVAASFEQAADALLAALLRTAVEALGQGGLRVLRGMVHLRPGDSYRGIRLREVDDVSGRRDGSAHPPRLMPSTTAWHFVERTGAAIVLDVRESAAYQMNGKALDIKGAPRAFDFRSRDALLGREATHILALPLWRPGHMLDGFVSIELVIGGAHGHTQEQGSKGVFVQLGELAPEFDVLVGLASPYIGMLPRVSYEEGAGEKDELLPVIGEKMRPLLEDLRMFAWDDDTLLFQGETGVGKSKLARQCVKISRRKNGPFVHVSLNGVSEALREAHLFGWTRGAFTGATENHKGYIEEANGGTLFIDEIDKLSPEGQAMLLTLLDDGEYRAIGDNQVRHADVRFMIGTNANLKQAIREGRFLEDLYHRIRDMPVKIPPLRERRDEIGGWARKMIESCHEKLGHGGAVELEEAAITLLEGLPWTGNLRQLNKVVSRAYKYAAYSNAATDVVVGVAHVMRSLERERDPDDSKLSDLLRQAAAGLFDVIAASDGSLTLDDADVFSGYVVCAAIDRLGERDAFRVLGRASSLKSSNHLKTIKREREKVAAFEAKLPRS